MLVYFILKEDIILILNKLVIIYSIIIIIIINNNNNKIGKKPSNDAKDLYREITFYSISESKKFPYLQRKVNIEEKTIVTLSPIENATKDIEDKVRETTQGIFLLFILKIYNNKKN
jgi:hypothetical protein